MRFPHLWRHASGQALEPKEFSGEKMRDLPFLKTQFLVGDTDNWGHGVAVSDQYPFFIHPTDCSDSAEDGGGSLTGWIWLSFLKSAYQLSFTISGQLISFWTDMQILS